MLWEEVLIWPSVNFAREAVVKALIPLSGGTVAEYEKEDF
jgi:hypothetical protein